MVGWSKEKGKQSKTIKQLDCLGLEYTVMIEAIVKTASKAFIFSFNILKLHQIRKIGTLQLNLDN